MKLLINKISFFLLSGLVMYSCKVDNHATIQFTGTWIESQQKSDTLVFGYNNLVELKRGRQPHLTNNSLLSAPVSSGMYVYTLKQDSIRLNYLTSSFQDLKYYVFRMAKDNLSIGDFYQKYPGKTEVLIFERMR